MAEAKDHLGLDRPEIGLAGVAFIVCGGAGVMVGAHLPLALALAATGWMLMRFTASAAVRKAVQGPAAEHWAIFGLFLLICLAGSAIALVRLRGWLGVWELLKSTYGILVIVWLVVCVTGGLAAAQIAAGLERVWETIRGRSRLEALTVLEALAGEGVLLGWYLLLMAGPGLADLLSTLLADKPALAGHAAWFLLTGTLATVFAWWEGSRNQQTSRARLLLAALAGAVHYRTVSTALATAYDTIISHIIVPLPWSLRIVLPATCIAMTWAALLFIFILAWSWRLMSLESLALCCLRFYFRYDPRGRVCVWLRHVGHLLTHRWSPARWLWGILIRVWQCLLGRLLPCFLPRPLTEPSRYEQFVRAQLSESEALILQRERAWRAALLFRQPEVGATVQGLAEASDTHARILLALRNYLVCPKCRLASSETTTWELASRSDRLLLTVESSRDHCLRAVKAEADFTNLRNQARRFYEWLQAQAGDAAFRELLIFRCAVLGQEPAEDLTRLNWREQAVRWMNAWGAAQSDRRNFAISALLAEFRMTKDWSGLIETCRLLSLVQAADSNPPRATYDLTKSDHLDLGEAWWHHASELRDGALGQWAWGQALQHFYKAGAEHHLNDRATPWRETNANVTTITSTHQSATPTVVA